MITLMHGDCLERMKEIHDDSVDMILTDLPYGIVKGMGADGWDDDTTYWDTVIDTDKIMIEANRILRKNGKLCLFAQQPFTTELITKAIPNLPFSYAMIWEKDHFANARTAKKAPVSYKEDILVFIKNNQKHDFEGLHPLRPYFKKVMDFIGLNKKGIIERIGQKADHVTRIESAQFGLCTEKTYNEMIETFEIDKVEGFKNFTELKKIDNDYRTKLNDQLNDQYSSVFNLWEGNKYKSNILKYKKDYSGYHPTQKPVLLLEDLIKTYSNEGNLIVDMTMGSGSTGVACVNTGRNFIGIELDERYFEIAKERINQTPTIRLSIVSTYPAPLVMAVE